MHWDANHDCSQLRQDRIEPFNTHGIETKFKIALESEREINKQSVDKDSRNQRTKISDDLIIEALKLNNEEYKKDDSHDVRQLQSLLGKGV